MSKTKGKTKMGDAAAALAAFDKAHGDDLSDEQKKKRAALKKDADAEKFRALANARATRALNAIEAIGKLARLPHTSAQVETLKGEFASALEKTFALFDAKAEKNGVKKVREIL